MLVCFQVLISLQGLVLVSKPYFNEAGYEKQMGTIEGEKNSLVYNESSYLLVCKSMQYLIKRPPKVSCLDAFVFVPCFHLQSIRKAPLVCPRQLVSIWFDAGVFLPFSVYSRALQRVVYPTVKHLVIVAFPLKEAFFSCGLALGKDAFVSDCLLPSCS